MVILLAITVVQHFFHNSALQTEDFSTHLGVLNDFLFIILQVWIQGQSANHLTLVNYQQQSSNNYHLFQHLIDFTRECILAGLF